MIGWEDIYKVVTAMAPLYVALTLGYASVRWWHMFKPEDCDAINRFNCYFIMPFFGFEFTAHVNPYAMNYKFISGDVVAKCIIGVGLAMWANFSTNGSLSWSITAFSLSSLNNTLVVGVPLLRAMYGQLGADLVVQSSVIQVLLWIIALLFMLELRRARSVADAITDSGDSPSPNSIEMQSSADLEKDGGAEKVGMVISRLPSFWSIMKIILLKLVKNPNAFSTILGLTWALLANRWHFGMPKIIEGSIIIMSKAGSAVAMFNLGLFMGLQGKIMVCGVNKAILGLILRFIAGPTCVAIGAVALGLRGKVLRIAVVQAALPQAIASFVYAQEYGLHADILSTAVIIGTIISLPLLIAYYAILDVLH